jgi:hypothetical protein
MGNNPDTFSRYPAESIDRSRDEALLKLSETDRADLRRLANDEIGQSNWFAHRALNGSTCLTPPKRHLILVELRIHLDESLPR